MFFKKSGLKNFAKFTGKHQCESLFFNKVAALRPATLLKNRLWHRCFPVNFAKFLRTPFLKNTPVGNFWVSQYTDLQSHFRSANYTACIRRRNLFIYLYAIFYGEVKNNNTMLKILPFIRVLYLKQQSSILRCFCRLKYEKSVTIRFSVLYFTVRWLVHTAEKDQIKYFAQN